jgi:uncharacterized membrane protein YtjA (UPF0391 family)
LRRCNKIAPTGVVAIWRDGRAARDIRNEEPDMLYWAIIFAVIALVAGVFGFGGVASAAAGVARILFFIFIVVFLVTLIAAIL